jgi:hypothetical protein
MDLGVYVSTLDEDVFIEATLKNIVKVFPQVEVIDLGSRDKTVEIVKRLGVPINEHVLTPKTGKNTFDGPPQQWTQLKNDYANKHEWIMILDGDEIFDEENLLGIKAKAESNTRITAYHIGWRMCREVKGVKQVSNMKPSGTKLYKSSDYYFKRGWPGEILKRNPDVDNPRERHKDIKEECDVWCWHTVLLNRSSTPERTARRKKKDERWNYYNEQLEWEDVDKWPWT